MKSLWDIAGLILGSVTLVVLYSAFNIPPYSTPAGTIAMAGVCLAYIFVIGLWAYIGSIVFRLSGGVEAGEVFVLSRFIGLGAILYAVFSVGRWLLMIVGII